MPSKKSRHIKERVFQNKAYLKRQERYGLNSLRKASPYHSHNKARRLQNWKITVLLSPKNYAAPYFRWVFRGDSEESKIPHWVPLEED